MPDFDGMVGKEGKSFNNVDLLARDVYIFIETTASKDANPTDFLYTVTKFDAGVTV
jgi:hypothetical protein